MRHAFLAAACALCLATGAQAQSAGERDRERTRGELLPPAGSHAVLERAVAERLGAVFSAPVPGTKAVVGHYLVCLPFTIGYDGLGNPVETITCDPVLVWCPNDDDDPCITLD